MNNIGNRNYYSDSSFKSGLTKEIKKQISSLDVPSVEEQFYKYYNTDAQFSNNKINLLYKNHKRSSSHFLSDAIHEWTHNVHLALICKKNGFDFFNPNDKLYTKITDEMNNYRPNKKTKKQIFETLGNYATTANSKMEIFTEGLTKIITESLDEKTLNIKRNPMDALLSMPKNIRIFIENQIIY